MIRRDFPITKRMIYMNNASSSPMPIMSIKAATDFMLTLAEYGPDSTSSISRIEELMLDTRKVISKMLNCNEQEIIFTHSTTEGINIVSKGLKMKGKILIRDGIHEHPANYIPWIRNEVVRLKIDEHGFIDLDEVKEKIVESKLVVLSHILFNTGAILPVEEVSKIAREYNVSFFIDAAQSVGAIEVDLKKIGCDFLSFPASKWLCGPSGIGVFYCKKEKQDLLEPLIDGNSYIIDDKIVLSDIPARFEAGFRNYAALAAFNSSLKYILSIGISNIRERNMKLARILREGLRDRKIYGPHEAEKRSSIVSFNDNNIDDLLTKLERAGIIFAKRDIMGKNIIRASPHFFNDEQEISRSLSIINA